MAKENKKQHYVPQFYLNSWAINEKTKQIYVYDKESDSYRKNAIEDVASERFFYDVNPNDVFSKEVLDSLRNKGIVWENDEKSQGIEHALCDLVEVPFSQLLHALINEAQKITPWHLDNCYFVSDEDKQLLSVFLAIQFFRTKHIRNTFLDSSDCLRQVLSDMGASNETIKRYSVDKENAKVAHTQMLLSADKLTQVASILCNHIWLLGINRTNKMLFTSDNPIVTYGHIKDSYMAMNGIASYGVEVVYPITPNIVLIMLERSYHKSFQSFEKRYVIINKTDRIDFYNSILSLQASRTVFSHDGEMSIIERMKKDDPEIFRKTKMSMQWNGKTYHPNEKRG